MGFREEAAAKSTADTALTIGINRNEELKKELSKDFTDEDWKILQIYISRIEEKRKKEKWKVWLAIVLIIAAAAFLFFCISKFFSIYTRLDGGTV